jgi:hypothetical protein
MAQATTPATIARDAAIGTLINQAGQAAASMLALCKDAASKAAAQLDPAKPMGERIATVVALYADDFKAAGHNVKSLFTDALTLHAAAQTPVSVKAIGTDGKQTDQHVKAADAVNMPKHAMRDAAKQVREAHNIGRKSGGGRKAAAPAAAVNSGAAADPAVKATEVDAFIAWLDNTETYLNDAVYHPRIVARLIELGYTLNKAAKGRKVTGTASA